MYLYGGDLPELPQFEAQLRLTFERPSRGLDGPPRVRCTVTAPSGARVGVDVTIPVQQWEAEAISSGFVVKQSRNLVTGLSDPAADVGSRLFDAVFQGEAGRLYADAVQGVERLGTGLTICVTADDPLILDLPWELLFDRSYQRTFLALSASNSIVRTLTEDFDGLADPIHLPPLRGLVVAGDPSLLPSINADIEALRQLADAFEVEVMAEPTQERLVRALREPYDVVHFAGSSPVAGSPVADRGASQKLAIPTEPGSAVDWVDAAQLRHLLEGNRPPRAVVLSASNTDRLAAEINVMVPVAVGLRGTVSHDARTAFNRVFYPALVEGASVPAAVAAGRTQVASTTPGDRGWAAPVVYAWRLGPLVHSLSAERRAGEVPQPPPSDEGRDLDGLQRAIDEANLDALERLWGRNREDAPDLVKAQWEQLEQRLGTGRVTPEVSL